MEKRTVRSDGDFEASMGGNLFTRPPRWPGCRTLAHYHIRVEDGARRASLSISYHRMLLFRGGDDSLVQKSRQMSAEGLRKQWASIVDSATLNVLFQHMNAREFKRLRLELLQLPIRLPLQIMTRNDASPQQLTKLRKASIE